MNEDKILFKRYANHLYKAKNESSFNEWILKIQMTFPFMHGWATYYIRGKHMLASCFLAEEDKYLFDTLATTSNFNESFHSQMYNSYGLKHVSLLQFFRKMDEITETYAQAEMFSACAQKFEFN